MRVLIAAMLGWLALLPAIANAADERPRFLQMLDRAYRSGDWVLQCDSSRICRITGVVARSRLQSGTRAIVIISRGIEARARYRVRFAFIDNDGNVQDLPGDDLTIAPGAYPHNGARSYAVTTRLTIETGAPLYPLYRAQLADGNRIVATLRRWPDADLFGGTALVSRLPTGNLGALLRRMDRLQRDPLTRLTPDEEATWMSEYNYAIVRAWPADGAPVPDAVLQSCAGQARADSHEVWQLDPDNRLHIAYCREGPRLFTQNRGAAGDPAGSDYGPPIEATVTDPRGQVRPVHRASFDQATSTLELHIAHGERYDCGLRLRYAFTVQATFGTLEDRRMPLCRSIPPAYWPLAWLPNSWTIID